MTPERTDLCSARGAIARGRRPSRAFFDAAREAADRDAMRSVFVRRFTGEAGQWPAAPMVWSDAMQEDAGLDASPAIEAALATLRRA